MAKRLFRFVSGDMVCSMSSVTLMDAWLKVELAKGKYGAEFTRDRNAVIVAYDAQGNVLGTRTWVQWHEMLMEDTYGADWRAVHAHAVKLM